ncbi:hypothetical protein WJX81_005821 [Elliptochloris bilobata]|uniref:Fatty acid desaturase domain-containing protein n=1 Tax=Elliptochloris bilobata TaxID=381761 RepID=A0AAW1S7W8_9CHLO
MVAAMLRGSCSAQVCAQQQHLSGAASRGAPLTGCRLLARGVRAVQPRSARLATSELRALAFEPVAPVADRMESSVAQLDAQQRAALAEELGYRTFGSELPEDVSLGDVIQSLPKSVFELNMWRAWGAVATTAASVVLSVYLIAISPWYLLPLAWAFAGTAWTGLIVIGHDCGHRSFSKNKLLEDIVGTLTFMPLIYPFEPWRLEHRYHHAHTNMLVEDTAWQPVPKAEADKWGPMQSFVYKTLLGSPLKLWSSVGHWLIWHFNLGRYTEKQRPRVLVSLAAVAAFMCMGFPAIVALSGWAGLAKFWLMPWLGYHFWLSTFTVVHHTAAHIPFKPAGEWNAAKAQLSGTVHCDFPRWVEFLCHDINVHVPHHISTKIPWYNLRAATDSLRANWGQYMTEAKWNPRMMKTIFTELHLYDEDKNYVPFDFKKEEPFWAFQRRVLPSAT